MKYKINLNRWNCCDGECGNNIVYLETLDEKNREVVCVPYDFYDKQDIEDFKKEAKKYGFNLEGDDFWEWEDLESEI